MGILEYTKFGIIHLRTRQKYYNVARLNRILPSSVILFSGLLDIHMGAWECLDRLTCPKTGFKDSMATKTVFFYELQFIFSQVLKF